MGLGGGGEGEGGRNRVYRGPRGLGTGAGWHGVVASGGDVIGLGFRVFRVGFIALGFKARFRRLELQ